MTRPTQEARYARMMLAAGRLWRAEADRSLAGHYVSGANGWALVQIGRLGTEVRQVDLARELAITGPSVVRLVDRLVRDGLVERRSDPADGRATHLLLTPQGRLLAAESERVLVGTRAALLDGVSDADLDAAIRVAQAIEDRAGRSRGR